MIEFTSNGTSWGDGHMRLRSAILGALIVLGGLSARIQAGPFVNLNFEQASIQYSSPQFLDAAAAFPGWTARLGSAVTSEVNYNNVGLGGVVVALYDQADPFLLIPLLEGQFDAILTTEEAPMPRRASLSQMGDVPAGSRSITLLAERSRGPPSVLMNGTIIPMINLSPNSLFGDPAWFGGDISSFAGSTVELRLESRQIEGVDAISFSSAEVPEPTGISACLALVGWCVKARRRWLEPL